MSTITPGPAGEAPDTARHRALSAVSRVRMLDLVRRAPDGLTAAQVVAATGLHPSTVRAHLDQLTESGLLIRHRRGDGTPGRPAWRYHAAPDSAAAADTDRASSTTSRAYRELANALISQLARDADDPYAAGVRAGRDRGRALAAQTAVVSGRRLEPIDGLVRVLERLGFTPRVVDRQAPGWAVVHLSSCPYLDAALNSPDVVCGVHHGIIEGALGALGALGADAELEPFALPGACVVRVRLGARAAGRPANRLGSDNGPNPSERTTLNGQTALDGEVAPNGQAALGEGPDS